MKILSNDYESNLPSSKNISWGGPGNFARSFSDFISEKNHKYCGIIFKSSKLKNPKIAEAVRGADGRAYQKILMPAAFRKTIAGAATLLDPVAVYRPIIDSIKKLIKETQPNVIFLNGFSDRAWSLMKAGYEAGIPIVMQHAGFLKIELDIYSDSFTNFGKKIFSDMEKEIGSLCDYEIFLNKWSRRKYSELIAPVNPQKSIVIPLPFSASHHRQDKRLKTAGPYHIGIIARWDGIKNHKAFLDVAIEAKKSGLPWIFHAITHIPKTKINAEFKNEYRRRVKTESPRPSTGLPAFYRQMDLMLLPSHFDVCPTVVLEAAAENLGTLISPNVGWVDCYKKNNAADWIIDFSNPRAVIKRIKRILNKPFPEKLIKTMTREHNPEKIFPTYLKLFEKIILKK